MVEATTSTCIATALSEAARAKPRNTVWAKSILAWNSAYDDAYVTNGLYIIKANDAVQISETVAFTINEGNVYNTRQVKKVTKKVHGKQSTWWKTVI